jgi:hypothetical protein
MRGDSPMIFAFRSEIGAFYLHLRGLRRNNPLTELMTLPTLIVTQPAGAFHLRHLIRARASYSDSHLSALWLARQMHCHLIPGLADSSAPGAEN